MSPVPYTWGPFLAKIFLKIDEIKIRPLTPPPRIISIHYLYWLLTRVYRKVGKKNRKKNHCYTQPKRNNLFGRKREMKIFLLSNDVSVSAWPLFFFGSKQNKKQKKS